jgi:hypothetical protein
MSTKTKVLCAQCDMPEQKCGCDKYCCSCESELNIRLCEEGLYYCADCRQACDYKVAE